MLINLVFIWGLQVLRFKKFESIVFAYVVAGVDQCAMGFYLLSWVFLFLQPTELSDLFHYSSNDLKQLQHVGISTCLIACGCVDFEIAWRRPAFV